jgi:hypothetical protein
VGCTCSSLENISFDFAETARSETIWKRAMDTVKEKGGAITVGVLTQLLANLVKTHYEENAENPEVNPSKQKVLKDEYLLSRG